MARDLAGLGQFAHGVAAAEQHLHDTEPVRVGEGLEALGRLAQALKARELWRAGGLSFGIDHDGMARRAGAGGGTATVPPIISEYSDTSISISGGQKYGYSGDSHIPVPCGTGLPRLFAGKCSSDSLVVHPIDGHDLRGRGVAAHHGDARGVDPEAFLPHPVPAVYRAPTTPPARAFVRGAESLE